MLEIELVTNARGREWWVKIDGTCIVQLDLSPRAIPIEVRRFAAQVLAEMIEKAPVHGATS